MGFHINAGVWPTEITLFNADGSIDYAANREFVARLLHMGCDGVFAICQSSEMFFLNIEEKVKLAKAVNDAVKGKASIVVSGHTADSLEQQIHDLKRMEDVGADALVLVSNRLVLENDSDFIKNTEAILNALPDSNFGFYECPYPFLRLLSDEELKWCADSGRIKFLKDVSCNKEIESRRVNIVKGSELKLFNANTQTLLHSLREGYYGYNGVMGNFHIDIYKWLFQNIHHEKAEYVQQWLSQTCEIEKYLYPVCCKYYLQLKGYPFSIHTRSKNASDLTLETKKMVADLICQETELRQELGLAVQQ